MARTDVVAARSQVRQPTYEDFQPESGWVEDAAANVLSIQLPGFSKDQIKVTYDEKPPRMTIRGEHPVGNNIIRRFIEDFPIPENCKINEMKAKFDQRQVLTITMPKKTIAQVTPKPKDTMPLDQASGSSPKKATPEIKPAPPKPQEEIMSLPTSNAAPESSPALRKEPEKNTVEKVAAPTPSHKAPSLPEPKTQNESPLKAPSRKQTEDKVSPSLSPLDSKAPMIPDFQKIKDELRRAESGLKQVDHKAGHQEFKALREKDQSQNKAGHQEYKPLMEKDQSQHTESSSQVTDRIGKEAGDLASAAKRAILGLDEERRLLVNAGVAVLVIVALGAYVGYKFGSSGGSHHKN